MVKIESESIKCHSELKLVPTVQVCVRDASPRCRCEITCPSTEVGCNNGSISDIKCNCGAEVSVFQVEYHILVPCVTFRAVA